MSRRRLVHLGLVLIAAALATLPATASASVTGQSFSATASPAFQSYETFGRVVLRVAMDTTYDSLPTSTTMSEADIHIDFDDFARDATNFIGCYPQFLVDTTIDEAMVQCGGSKVGSGTAIFSSATTSYPSAVTVFQGNVMGGYLQFILHIRLPAPFDKTLLVYGPGTATPPAYSDLDLHIPDTSADGLNLTHLDFTIDAQFRVNHWYISARCHGLSKVWNFAGDFSFRGGRTFRIAQTQPCDRPATGLKSAAIKRCKKRYAPRRRPKAKRRAAAKRRKRCIGEATRTLPD